MNDGVSLPSEKMRKGRKRVSTVASAHIPIVMISCFVLKRYSFTAHKLCLWEPSGFF